MDDAILKRPYIVSARSNMRFRWDIIIIVCAVVNAIFLPLEIAFNEMIEKLTWYEILDNIMTCIFATDILVGFFTSYVNISSGDEIFSMSMIANNYIFKGSFVIDMLSTIPLDLIAEELGGSDSVI